MNTFLQGCCFIPPEDDIVSTPSFLELSPHRVPSSRYCLQPNRHGDTRCNSRPSSKATSCSVPLDGNEIVFLKRYPGDAWADSDEGQLQFTQRDRALFEDFVDRMCGNPPIRNSSGAGIEATKGASKPRARSKASSSSNARLILSEDEFRERMSFLLCQSPRTRQGSASYMSAYESKSPQRPTTSTSRLLDFFLTCFWKCSPGCQQIPTING